MINVKDQVYAALLEVCENTADIYPKQVPTFPFIFYCEEQNRVYEWTDDREQMAELRFRIEIWNDGSTSDLTLAVDEAITRLGLKRTDCHDNPSAEGYRCKQMRYEGIIDVNDEHVYHQGAW